MPALASSPQGTPITPHQPKGRDGYYSKAAATVTATAKPNEDPNRDKPPPANTINSYSQSSSLSSSALRPSRGLLGALLGLPDAAPTMS